MSDTIKGFLINGEILHYDYNALDNVPDNGTGTFWAIYGTTTSNEIEGAIASNKTVALNYENHIYYLSSILDKIAPNNIYLFRSEDNVANYQIMMSGSNWQPVRVLDWIQPSNDGPLPLLEDGVSSPGISAKYSRGDHQHPMPEMDLGIDQNDGLLYFYINNNKHGNGIPISGSSGSGLTEMVKLALLQLASKVPYIDEHGEDYYQDLYDAFYSNFFNVTYILEGCSSSNTNLTAKEGGAYTTTISANTAYSLTGATASITMGGVDVTGAYSNGMINIPNVTGDIVITVIAVLTVSSISAVYTQSGTVYDNDTLDILKPDLVVTANNTDGSTSTISDTDYTLSGTLTEGSSIITASYAGKTATFTVTVTKYALIENFTRVGNPQIVDGIMTASDGCGITTLESFNPGSNPWELTVKLYRPSIPGKYERFVTSAGEGLKLETAWSDTATGMILNSESGQIVGAIDRRSVPAEQWRWLRIVFAGDATGYDYGWSSDGVTFTYIGGNNTPFTGYRNGAYKTATPIKAGAVSLATMTGNYASIAQYDLMETEIKVNGETWWKPYIPPTRGVS